MVLMNKVVAVEHVDTIVRGVACNDCDLLVLAKEDNVLQSLLLVVEDRTLTTGASQNLEVNKVDVYGVIPATAVLKLPNLDGTTLRPGQDAVVDISESETVNSPLTTSPAKLEAPVNSAPLGREGDSAKRIGKVAVVGCVRDILTNSELHDLIGGVVILMVLNIAVILESDVHSGKFAEVKDHLPAFSHGDLKVAGLHRLGQETCVSTNYREVDHLAVDLECELEGPANSSVEEA